MLVFEVACDISLMLKKLHFQQSRYFCMGFIFNKFSYFHKLFTAHVNKITVVNKVTNKIKNDFYSSVVEKITQDKSIYCENLHSFGNIFTKKNSHNRNIKMVFLTFKKWNIIYLLKNVRITHCKSQFFLNPTLSLV